MSQCKAKSKRTHKQCTRPAMKGKAVCYHHGGKSPGVKNNQNAKTHGAYATTLTTKDKAAHDTLELDHLDAEIRRNAVLEHRGFELSNSKQYSELGLKLAGEAINRARKLKMSRAELQRAKESDNNKPLPWVD